MPAIGPGPAREPLAPPALGALLGMLIAPSALGVTAATVALSDAARALDTTTVALAWPLTAYIACLALASAVGARMISVVGSGAVLRGGVALTVAGAIGVAIGPALETVTVARAVLGLGAGALAAVALALAGEMPAATRPRVLGALAGVMAAVMGAGPLVGGLIAPWSWRTALVLPVVAVAAAPIVERGVPAVRRRVGSVVDAAGALLLAVGVAGLVVALQVAATDPDAAIVAALAVASAAGFAGTVVRVRRRPDGFLPRDVVGRRDFAGWWLMAFGAQGGQVAALVVVPQLLGGRHGWSTTGVGAVLAALSLAGVAASRLAAARTASRGGPAIAAVSLALLAIALVAVPVFGQALWPPLVVGAIGFAALSAVQVVAIDHVSARVPGDLVPIATGVVSLALLIGGAAGSAATSLATSALELDWGTAAAAALPGLAALCAVAVALPRGAGRARGQAARPTNPSLSSTHTNGAST